MPSNAIVARGLVHRVCLQGLVSQRRSKLNYGVRTQLPYEGSEVHGKWAEVKPKIDDYDRDSYIDTIEWFLPKAGLSLGQFHAVALILNRTMPSSRARRY